MSRAFVGGLIGMLACACAPQGAMVASDGLVRRASASLDAVYVRPQAEPRAYRKVFVAPVIVSLPSAGHRASEEPELLRNEMAKAVRRSLIEAFRAAGYEIAGATEADSLDVEARVSDLFTNAPEMLSSSPRKMLVRDVGDARLLLEARDARTGVVLERISHHAVARSGATLTATDDVLNRMAFDALFRRWAASCVAQLGS